MNQLTRLTALILSIAVTMCIVPTVYAAEGAGVEGETQISEKQDAFSDDKILGEEIEKRGMTTKTFRMTNGARVIAGYGMPVHFGKDGEWFDYDNTLKLIEKDGAAMYAPKATDVVVAFAATTGKDRSLLSWGRDERGISFTLLGARDGVAPLIAEKTDGYVSKLGLEKYTSGLVYKDILSGVDVEYVLAGSSVKEDIVINRAGAENTFAFVMSLCGLEAVEKDGGIDIVGEDGGTVAAIPAGYMYDADGNTSDAVYYDLSQTDGGEYLFTVTADAEWLADKERAFPVRLDPSLFEGAYLTNEIDDAYTVTGSTSSSGTGGNQFFLTGYTTDTRLKYMHAFVKLNALPEIPESAVIVEAALNLKQVTTDNGWMGYKGTASSLDLAVRTVEGAWTESTIRNSNAPSVSSTILDYQTVTSISQAQVNNGANPMVRFDITAAVQEWYNGTRDNYGVCIYPVTEYAGSGDYAHTGFYSSENPYQAYQQTLPMFYIGYRDTKGLESIWSYASHDVGSAGTGCVNLFNGNLVAVRGDVTTKGSLLPVTVSHVFNNSYAGKQFDQNTKVGAGWKLSVQETVLPKTIDGLTWYVYNDADGTDLYFMPFVNGESKSEDGYPLTLTVSNGEYILTDDYGNVKTFNSSGRLVSVEDVNGNEKLFVYNNSRLETITDGSVNGAITFSYDNTDPTLLTEISGNGETIGFSYTTQRIGTEDVLMLATVTSSVGGSCTYTYDADGFLVGAHDSTDLYGVEYTYSEYHGAKRVSSVYEFCGPTSAKTYGKRIGILYSDKKTVVRTSGTDDVYNNSDDILTSYVFDDYGKVICTYSSDLSGDSIYGAGCAEYTEFAEGSKLNNRITVDAVKGVQAHNFLPGGSFETDNTVSFTSSSTNVAISTDTAEHFFGERSRKYLVGTDAPTGTSLSAKFLNVGTAGTYTFSAYVKTVNMTGGSVCIKLGDVSSQVITETTDTGVQNGWRRIYATKMLASASAELRICVSGPSGSAVYFDGMQLERSDAPSRFELIANGDFESTSLWEDDFTQVTSGGVSGKCISVSGDVSADNAAHQSVPVLMPAGTTFILSGWAKANSASLVGERKFGLTYTVNYTDGTSDDAKTVYFDPHYTDWQYKAGVIVTGDDDEEEDDRVISTVDIYCDYSRNVNTAWFDNVSLTAEPAYTYVYEEANGNITSVSVNDKNGNSSLADYASNGVDVASEKNVLGQKYEYTYRTLGSGNDQVDTHQVETVKKFAIGDDEDELQRLTYGYDGFGNAVSATLTATGSNRSIKSTAAYTTDGGYMESVTDTLGNTTSYGYDQAKDLLSYIENAKGKRTAYTYGTDKKTGAVYLDADKDGVRDVGEVGVSYGYTGNRLTSVSTPTASYTINYDGFGNTSSILCGTNTLASYTYASGNGKLLSMTYGNGAVESYTYDELERLKTVSLNNVLKYTLAYTGEGSLYSCVDNSSGITYTYDYDSTGRLINAFQNGGEADLAVENKFDNFGRPDSTTYVIDGESFTSSVEYDDETGNVSSHSSGGALAFYGYDEFDRLQMKIVDLLSITEQFSYVNKTVDNESRTSTLVSQKSVSMNNETVTMNYTYDALGNITSDGTHEYTYDSLNRLVEVRDYDAWNVTKYSYDDGGNITGRLVQDWYEENTLSSKTYSYTGDRLTSLNGETIYYDTIGNPENWRSDIYLEWQGRKLTSYTCNSGVYSITYNSDGVRVGKSAYHWGDEDSYSYVLDGTKILAEIYEYDNTTRTIYFLYDQSGDVMGFKLNGNVYYYVKNIQGDIIYICNSSGTKLVTYSYDPWGVCTVESDTSGLGLGNKNPFRYRSYYYDKETGFYYLNSRYYDPQVGRFINEDGLVSTGQGILGYNMYVYCNDNPVNFADSSGERTIAFGVNGTFACLSGVSITYSIVIDDEWNIAIQKTVSDPLKPNSGAIFSTPSASLSLALSRSAADTVYDLEGNSHSAGGSITVCGPSIGVEVSGSIYKDLSPDNATVSVGAGLPILPFECHYSLSKTETLYSFNVLEKFPIIKTVIEEVLIKWVKNL